MRLKELLYQVDDGIPVKIIDYTHASIRENKDPAVIFKGFMYDAPERVWQNESHVSQIGIENDHLKISVDVNSD